MAGFAFSGNSGVTRVWRRLSCFQHPYIAAEKSRQESVKMPGNKKKNKGANKAKNAAARSNAANKDDLAGLDDLLR